MAKQMKPAKIRCAAFVATMLLAVMAACDGSSSVGNLDNRGRLTLQQVQLGRQKIPRGQTRPAIAWRGADRRR
jgi:hypothetical protein